MGRNIQKNFQYITRWLLLISVLTGIFFSNGEGVQLFPFPVSPDTAEKNSNSLEEEGNCKSYYLSAHKFTNLSLSLKSKSQKNTKGYACGTIYANNSGETAFFSLLLKQNFKETTPFYTSGFLIQPSDRAPPTA